MHLAVRQLLRLAAVAWFVVRGLRHRRHHHHHHDAGLRGSAGSTCFKGPLSWRGVNGELRVNSETFHLKGEKGTRTDLMTLHSS